MKRTVAPEIEKDDWSRGSVDRFLLAKMIPEGLQPAAEADKATLIRRVTFDLIGLPPTPEEVDAFVDDGGPDAYERLVDRLLASPRYGERWARHWLDLVRYAESDGYKQDAYRPSAWRYRDYVIRSLNDDKPYDRFVQEQLAGDEIAPDDPEALVATGFSAARHLRVQPARRAEPVDDHPQRHHRRDRPTCSSAWAWAAPAATTTSSTRSCRRTTTACRRSSPRSSRATTCRPPRRRRAASTSEQLDVWEEKTAEVRRQIDAIEKPHRRGGRQGVDRQVPRRDPGDPRQAGGRADAAGRAAWRAGLPPGRSTKVARSIAKKLKGDEKTKWEGLKKQLAEFDHVKPAAAAGGADR